MRRLAAHTTVDALRNIGIPSNIANWALNANVEIDDRNRFYDRGGGVWWVRDDLVKTEEDLPD